MDVRVIAVANETNSSFSRNTCDGRRLTYKLKVLQQPERARACGSGAKSSADRRPVDPPPIVELRIYEGEKAENDVTFAVNANYFLFATLEQARPIAQGRVPNNDSARLTVLTGTPVAGMVYLDRPEPAGYFIFPDLSVRHEGKYRLGFSLYEELKDAKDADQIDDSAAAPQGEAQINHRLEVKSEPFTVYSAKKFPGLKSSTQLSRTVADQGCRVRIRREVRMRRREKAKDFDGYSDRSRHSITPDLYSSHMAGPGADLASRERSASIASHASLAAAPLSHRQSAHEMAQPYPQPSYAPPAPQAIAQPPTAQPAPPAQSSYPQPTAHQYAPQYAQQQQQTRMQPPSMQPAQHQVHYAHYQYPYSAAPGPTQQQAYYGYGQATQQHAQHEETPSARTMSVVDYSQTAPQPADFRRHSMIQSPSYSHNGYNQGYSSQYQQPAAYVPQPLTPKARQMSQASVSGASAVAPRVLPPINTSQGGQTKLEISPPTSAVTQNGYHDTKQSTECGQINGKRPYDLVFDTRHMNGPLRQGARPSYSHMAADDGNDSELCDLQSLKMSYRRADGRSIARPLPPSHD